MKIASVLQQQNIQKLQALFSTERDYRSKMQTLQKTRNALHQLWEKSPLYKNEILEQAKALNELISALLIDNLPHPWLEDDPLFNQDFEKLQEPIKLIGNCEAGTINSHLNK